MRRWSFEKRSPIGLDVGARQVKAVQLARAAGTSSGWHVALAASFPRSEAGVPVSPAEAKRIADVLFRKGFSGGEVVLAVPPDKLLREILELPPRGAAVPHEQIARMELSRTHRCAPDSFELGCWDLPAPARSVVLRKD